MTTTKNQALKAGKSKTASAHGTRKNRADELHAKLWNARNAALTTALALDGSSGAYQSVAMNLRRHVLCPIDDVLAVLKTRL